MPPTHDDAGDSGRCGKRYGKNRRRVCRKDAGHRGPHAYRLPLHRILGR
jgi:hypothetical protein